MTNNEQLRELAARENGTMTEKTNCKLHAMEHKPGELTTEYKLVKPFTIAAITIVTTLLLISWIIAAIQTPDKAAVLVEPFFSVDTFQYMFLAIFFGALGIFTGSRTLPKITDIIKGPQANK